MKLNDLISLIDNGDLNNTKNEKLKDFINFKFVRMPLLLKRSIIKEIADASIYQNETTELLCNDPTLQDLLTTISVITECTDIEIENLYTQDTMDIKIAAEAYDLIKLHQIDSFIYDVLHLYDLEDLIDAEIIQTINNYNSSAHILLKIMKVIQTSIPDTKQLQELIQPIIQENTQITNTKTKSNKITKSKK